MTEAALHAKRHRKEMRRRHVRAEKRKRKWNREEAARRFDWDAYERDRDQERKEAQERQAAHARVAALAEKRTAAPSFLRRVWNRVTGRGS